MFGLFSHPATQFACRHCGATAGSDPEMCYRCGPICADCHMADEYPCDKQIESDNPLWQQIIDAQNAD